MKRKEKIENKIKAKGEGKEGEARTRRESKIITKHKEKKKG